MTDQSASGPKTPKTSPEAAGRTTTETVEARTELDPEQERAVRMRRGFPVSDEQPLPQKGEGRPDVKAQLRALELEAFEKSGRYAELAAEVGVDLSDPEQRAGQRVKRKIIDRLTDPSQ